MQIHSEPVIVYRAMNEDDIQAGMQLCRASGWNQVQRDWKLFLQLSPQGCRVAVHKNQVVGTVATIRYQERFSWLGMVLVDPAVRGLGIGSQLLEEALTILRAEQCVRLDATPFGYPLYRKLGFVEEYQLRRMECAPLQHSSKVDTHNAQPMREAELTEICALDQLVFGADRRVLLEWLLADAPELAWVVRRNKKLAGYAFGRRGFNFTHAGPLVALDEAVAHQLVTAGLRQNRNEPLILDVPQQQVSWLNWLAALGFHEQRPFIRMFRGAHRYPGQAENQFAMLGPEFG